MGRSQLPRGWVGAERFPLPATAAWADQDKVARELKYRDGMMVLGAANNTLVGVRSEMHMTTLAATRSGKGVSQIIPNMLLYRGPVVAIDPKAELATITAKRRRDMGQNVYVLDPFERAENTAATMRCRFNPMDRLHVDEDESADEASLIADSLIIQSTKGDPHWTLAARNLVKTLILVLTCALPRDHPNRNLIGVRRELMQHDVVARLARFGRMEPRSLTWERARELALVFAAIPEDERGSILSSARTQTEFLDSPAMARVLSGSDFRFEDLKEHPGTVYLCLPASRLATHGRWLRLMINCALDAMERKRKRLRDPVLFILDEFYSLGRMERIEKAAGLMAGYGVKLWTILQDLQQLQANHQSSWQTFLGNSGVVQAFGNTDPATCEFLSKRLGKVTIATASENAVSMNQQMAGHSGVSRARMTTELLQPDEIEGHFAAHLRNQLVLLGGHPPMQLDRIRYFEHPAFKGLYEPDPAYR